MLIGLVVGGLAVAVAAAAIAVTVLNRGNSSGPGLGCVVQSAGVIASFLTVLTGNNVPLMQTAVLR